MSSLIFWIIMLICMVIVCGIQYRNFGTIERARTPENIASFFFVHEVSDKWQRNLCAVAALVPLSFLFFVISYNSDELGKRLVYDLLGIVEASENASGQQLGKLESFLKILVDYAPGYTYPLFLLAVSFIFFGAQLRFLYRHIERGVTFVSGISNRTNSLLMNFSTTLLNYQTYEQIVHLLEKMRPTKLPLAEELEYVSDENKLSFLLLHVAKPSVPEVGIRRALRNILDTKISDALTQEEYDTLIKLIGSRHVNKIPDLDTISANSDQQNILSRKVGSGNSRVEWIHMTVAIALFLIVCLIYVAIVPRIPEILGQFEILWPESAQALAKGIILLSLATIVPFTGGIRLYDRRVQNFGGGTTRDLVTIFLGVFLFSLIVNSTFVMMQRVEFLLRLLDNFNTASFFGFLGLAETVYIFSHSLVPSMALLTVVLVSPKGLVISRSLIIAVVVVAGGHLISYAAFETAAGVSWQYYWHQGLLGFVLGSAAMLIMGFYWKPDKVGQRHE